MQNHPSIEEKEDSIWLTVNVHPNSSSKKIEITENTIEIYVNEPPDKGKANKALLKLMSKKLRIQSSSISIIKGHKTRKKIILIRNINMIEILEKIKKTN
ncbi:MAG: DUF167 domain-containing protein [Candidatus Heimdallarchaeota archaeon]|nr:DUF167 domain-containing protein [Candidatus Heimdallarchaeota archaeon]MCK4955441.1 DUF167 domain-containing protein [Candidatus Heimdallarchaeota archaeon]